MKDSKRLHRCCFTGHRPEKIGMSEEEIKQRLRLAIKDAINDGFTTFISGMARGVDIWAAEIVLDERKNNDRIKLICASPYKGFEERWEISEKEKYNKILNEADFVKFVCEHYSKSCFQIRNCYMVDNSARVISAYCGISGGTKNTVLYAQRKKVEIVNVCNDKLEFRAITFG